MGVQGAVADGQHHLHIMHNKYRAEPSNELALSITNFFFSSSELLLDSARRLLQDRDEGIKSTEQMAQAFGDLFALFSKSLESFARHQYSSSLSVFPFNDLPDELLSRVMAFSSNDELCDLALVSKKFHHCMDLELCRTVLVRSDYEHSEFSISRMDVFIKAIDVNWLTTRRNIVESLVINFFPKFEQSKAAAAASNNDDMDIDQPEDDDWGDVDFDGGDEGGEFQEDVKMKEDALNVENRTFSGACDASTILRIDFPNLKNLSLVSTPFSAETSWLGDACGLWLGHIFFVNAETLTNIDIRVCVPGLRAILRNPSVQECLPDLKGVEKFRIVFLCEKADVEFGKSFKELVDQLPSRFHADVSSPDDPLRICFSGLKINVPSWLTLCQSIPPCGALELMDVSFLGQGSLTLADLMKSPFIKALKSFYLAVSPECWLMYSDPSILPKLPLLQYLLLQFYTGDIELESWGMFVANLLYLTPNLVTLVVEFEEADFGTEGIIFEFMLQKVIALPHLQEIHFIEKGRAQRGLTSTVREENDLHQRMVQFQHLRCKFSDLRRVVIKRRAKKRRTFDIEFEMLRIEDMWSNQ
jgi:hypothetical protein